MANMKNQYIEVIQMDKPIVSIIIPVYNPPMVCFQKCITSVLEQTYQRIEVIIIDDGSDPSYVKEIDDWSQRDSRVSVFHQPNRGVSNARNRGIELATGKYINFVDADDQVEITWLEKAVIEAEKRMADIVYGCVSLVRAGNIDQFQCGHVEERTLSFEGSELWRVQKMLLQRRTPLLSSFSYLDHGPCGKLYKTEIAKKILFPTDLSLAEDQVFNHAFLRQSKCVIVTNFLAYYYVLNDDSATQKWRPDAVDILLNAEAQIQKLLFNQPEVYNVYYYHFILEMQNGINISYFNHENTDYNFFEKWMIFRKIFAEKPVREAVRSLHAHTILNVKR